MSKNFTNTLFLFAVTLIFIVTGCGSSGSSTDSLATNAAQSKVFGVASLGTTATSTVTVKDSSVPSQEKTAALSSNGSYTADVSGLKAPFILKASGTDETGGNLMLYSVSTNGGRANINEISDLAVAAAASMDTNAAGREMTYTWSKNNDDNRTNADNFDRVINSLRTVLAPLFALYQISGNPITEEDGDEYEHDGEYNTTGLSAMLHDVRFTVNDGKVLVRNRATGAIIFSGSLGNLDSGTFYPENMPAGPGGSTACTYTYSNWGTCQSNGTQTRTIATSSPSGCTGTPVLTQSCTYVPPTSACTYNYSNWGACQSNGTQTRTVLQSTPAGCTGTPVLSQSCTYVPPVNACTSFTYSAWGTCQSNGTQTRTVATSTPTGCTGGTPVLSQSCTYVPPVTTCTSFTYSAWGTCQSNGTQTRTVATSTPTGCTGGTPVLSQSCTYVPPTCTSFTYNAWGTCQSNGTQTRTVATSAPAGCTGGTPVLSQACTPTSTVTLALVQSTCTQCHGLTVNTTVFKAGGYSVSGRTASGWVSALNGMLTPPAGTTIQDFANFLVTVP